MAPPLTRSSTALYRLGVVDDRGRVADQALICAIGWPCGTGLAIQEAKGRLTIHPNECSVTMITKHGHLRLPAAIRHRVGLRLGDRVLLAADLNRQVRTVYPPAVLDVLLAGDFP
ncbi:hypothetical protein ALI144C_00545 [Actinosynnema sp. ALI-1.44]|nr:hypothetical protein ALI144C_00545 [Actinosynnema sp. ALI-1.44]